MLSRLSVTLTPVLLILSLSGCGEEGGEQAEKPGVSARQVSVSAILPEEGGGPTSILGQYDIGNESPEVLELPGALTEISGLATTQDGRLFGHNDETGVVRQISIKSGDASSWFNVGSITLSEDLEGIAIVGETFYLVNSKGDIFEFREGVEGESVDFVQHKTGLSGKFDVEGLCYDPGTNALLLACKEYPGDGLDEKKHRAVYSFSLGSKTIDPEPRFVLPVNELEKHLDIKKFSPSAIERHPDSGHFVLLSGNDPAIIELSPTGAIVAAHRLDPSVHAQPEGIAFGPDGELLIGNEGGKLIRYPKR